METIVRLFRTLANLRRIQVLRLLAVLGELPVTAIGDATGLDPARLSAHLGLLAATGFLWRRRSGRAVYYRLAGRPGNPIAAAALRSLRRVFAAIRDDDPRRVARADRGSSPTECDAALFACFTAFTHPRRLQIIRYVARQGTAALVELSAALAMSPRACLRHLEKLERRGFLRRSVRARLTTYALLEGRGHLQRAMLRAVRERLVDMTN
jgi:DNA-binding MarR family transcriptional regulator